MADTPTRLAIIGGGLAGVTLANALIRIPHLDVHVYEAAPEFSERGAAVGIAKNALAALRHIFPSVDELLARAGAVPQRSARNMIGSGPRAGTFVFDVPSIEKEFIVHRASLLRELLAPLPKERLHANKKLIRINSTTDGVEIAFEDGSAHIIDAVVGADGIFSSVRDYVLQDAAEECAASPAGFWDSRNVVPFEKAKATLGEDYFDVDRKYSWAGDGAFIMHDVLENRTMVQCIIAAVEKDPPKDRKRVLTREVLMNTLSSWLDGPIAKGMIDLMLEQPDPQGYSEWEHKKTPTYANGRVCIMGDAAHATTPWQGAGAGQAFEDAMVLGALLGSASSVESIKLAFTAYDEVRRPRCQQVIESSKETGEIMCWQKRDVELNHRTLMAALENRWTFIYDLDPDTHKTDALSKMRYFEAIGRGVPGTDLVG